MKAMIPRFGVILISLALVGCGLELLSPLKQLSTSSGADGFQYSWPLEMALPLGSLSLSLDDPDFARSLFGDVPVNPGHDERLHLLPVSQSLEPISFGNGLELKTPVTIAIPPQGLPDVNHALPDIPFPDIVIGAETLMGVSLPPGHVVPSTLTYVDQRDLPIPGERRDFLEAKVGTPPAQLEFTLHNHLGVRFYPTVRIYATRNGTTRQIAQTESSVDLEPGQSRKLTIPLYENALLTPDLAMRVDIKVPGGQRMQAPITGIAMTDMLLATKNISHLRVAIASHSLPIPDLAVDLGLGALDLEADAIRRVVVEEGMLELTLSNQFPVTTTVALEFPNLVRLGQTQPIKAVYELRAGSTLTPQISLSGVSILPENGKITVKAHAETKDTGPEGALVALDGSQRFSGQVQLQAPLRIREVEVPVKREVALPNVSLPLELPPTFNDLGIRLQDVVLSLSLSNTSALPGSIAIDLKAEVPGKGTLSLTDLEGKPVRFPLKANMANDLRISSENSNLLELLDAKPTALSVGGTITVDSKGEAVRLSASDRIDGHLAVEMPLTIAFSAFGGAAERPAFEVRPATALSYNSENQEALSKVDRAVLKLDIDNGWMLPFDLDLLFSSASDPFTDPDAFVLPVSLGNATGGYRVNNALTLEGESLARFRKASMLGMRLRSPGTSTAVSIYRGSRIRVNLGLTFKATVSSGQVGP